MAIDAITATADEHKLFSQEYLPAGSRFAVALEAEKLADGDLEILLGLLEAWDGGAESSVGRGASRMQGRLAWNLDRVEVLDAAALQSWLVSDQPLDAFFRSLEPPAATRPTHKPGLASIPFRIHPLAPILVNDPSYARRKPGDGGPKENEDAPNLEFSRTADGRPLIPAASLRGLVRGRARRILATLLAAQGVAAHQAGDAAEQWVKKLFGHQKARSPVWLGDAVPETTATPHPQHFNAIDRFTGGVAEGKLYQVEARTGGIYSGEIGLELDRLDQLDRLAPDWWKGLLFLVLRDALEGDMAVGWGKARGYGAFRLAVEWRGRWIESWPDLLAYLEEQPGQKECAQAWIDSLHDTLDRVAADLNAQEPRP